MDMRKRMSMTWLRAVAESYVEFADNTIAGSANEKLVSLWLRPHLASRALRRRAR